MAKGFNLTAQINLRGPTNLKPIVADIKRQLGSISSDVNVKLNPQVAKSISTVTSRLKSMNDMLVTAKSNSDSLNTSLSNLSTSLSSIGNSGSKSVSAISKTASSTKTAAQNIKQATTEMEQFGKQSALAVRRFAAFSLATGAIFKLVNAINSGFNAFVNFDKQLVKLQQVTGKGAIGLKNLENQITNLATSLGVSSESLIEVASTLAQAGLNAEETRIALSALAKTELAPSFDSLTETTEGAIAALRQFELQAGDLESALGSINAVAAAFAVESSDIITAIQRTGGVFAAASKGVSEGKDALNEFIAVFTSVRATTRESAETIATGLRTIFTRIQRGKTIEALKEYGVILTDLEGKFVGPYEAVKRLSEGLKLLDPRDLRFSQIVEELGGFRQIGKVIPLIQQFSEAQKALRIAQTGQSSLTDAQVTAQKSLANQIAKVREQFLALIRDVGKSATFQAITKIVLNLTSAFISLAGAFKPILPFLAILGTIKGVKALGEFGTGFFGGLKSSQGGGTSTAKNIGTNIGNTISGSKEKEKAAATKLATDAIQANTSALKSLTVAINSLDNTIKSRGSTTFATGGKVLGFNRGGLVPGSGNKDSIRANLTPGEFVMRKGAVKDIGTKNLSAMNNGGTIQKFMAGSLSGVKRKGIDWKNLNQGRGKRGKKGARSRFDLPQPGDKDYLNWVNQIYAEYDADPSLPRVMANGIQMPPEIAYAEKLISQEVFERGGSGMMLGYDAKGREVIGKFGRSKTKKSGSLKKTPLGLLISAAGMQRGVRAPAGEMQKILDAYEKDPEYRSAVGLTSSASVQQALSAFRKSGGQSSLVGAFPGSSASKIKSAIPQYITSLGDEPQKVAKANTALQYFDSFISGGTASKPGHATAFTETVNQILKSGLVQEFAEGGNVQISPELRKQIIASGSYEKFINQNMLDSIDSDIYKFGMVGLRSGTKSDTNRIEERPLENGKKARIHIGYLQSQNDPNFRTNIENDINKSLQKTILKTAGSFGQDINANIDPQTKNQILDGAVLSSAVGSVFESALQMIGAPYIDKIEAIKSIDFPFGLGTSSKLFGDFPGNIPTDATRTIAGSGKGISDFVGQINRFITAVDAGKFTTKLEALPTPEALSSRQMAEALFGAVKTDPSKQSDINSILREAGIAGVTIKGQTTKSKDSLANNLARNPETIRKLEDFLSLQISNNASGGKISAIPSVKGFASGGTVPAMVSSGEAFVPPKLAKKIGYGKLNKMNQADRNGAQGFSGGGISVFKGSGSGTSDSIGPIGLPEGSFIIREKATKALGLNRGGIVGSIKKFFKGGQSKKDAVRAQGQILSTVEEGATVFADIMSQLPTQLKDIILSKFKGIQNVQPGQAVSSVANSPAFTERTRGMAVASSKASAIGLQITGKKGGATTETVAHETGHLADMALGGGSNFASETQGTFQFELIAKIKKQMEDEFKKAGKSAEEIDKYLGTGKELFAEFFAKASPEVRAIITSTTDAKVGMEKLVNALGETGFTYAGLEASDLVPPKPKSKKSKQKDQFGYLKQQSKAIDEAKTGAVSFESLKPKTKSRREAKQELDDSGLKALTTGITQTSGEIAKLKAQTESLYQQSKNLDNQIGQYDQAILKIRSSTEEGAKGNKALNRIIQMKISAETQRLSVDKQAMAGEEQLIALNQQKAQQIAAAKTFKTTGGGGGGGPSGPDLPKIDTTGKNPYADETAFIQYKARKEGMGEGEYRRSLATKIADKATGLQRDYSGRKEEFKQSLVARRESFQGIDKTTDVGQAQFNTAVAELAREIQDLNPELKFEDAKIAAEKLANDLAVTGDRARDVGSLMGELGNALPGEIDATKALELAKKQVAKQEGMSEGTLSRAVNPKEIQREQFIRSPEGQRFGKLAEFAPGLTQKFAGTKAGQALGKGADFISGKGGRFSKLFAGAGGFQGIGSGIAVGSEMLKTSGLIDKKTLKNPNVAGAFGAVQGAGVGAATGAELGGAVAGDTGRLVGAIGGAIIGGIKGFFDAKNAQILTNALDKLTKSSEGVDIAFKELAKNDTDKNFKNVQKAFGQQIEASKELENIAFSGGEGPSVGGVGGGALAGAGMGALGGAMIAGPIGAAIGAALGGLVGGVTAYMSASQSKANREEALRNRVGSAGAMNESAARMAERQMGRMTTEELGKQQQTGANVIAEQYKQSAIAAAEAANGTKNLTAAQKEQISQSAAETAYLDAYMKMRKEAGATDEKISEDILADRKLALQEGKKALQVQNDAAVKQALLARATKEVALATENLLDVYRRVGAKAQRFSDEVDDMLSGTQSTIASLGGNAAVQKVDRTGSERILGNMSAYSSAEVKAATQEMVGKLGGGEEAQALGKQAEAAKFLQDKLPAMLREPGADPSKIIDSLSQELSTMGLGGDAIDKMLGEIEKQISDNEKGGLGTLADEISSGGIDKLSMTAAEAAKTLQNLSKTYNDTLQKSIDLQNQYNETVMQSNAYLRKAGTIRINAELDLAKALGNSPTLEQLNQPFDFEIQDLTKGLVPGGTSDPAAIAAGIAAKTAENKQLQEANTNLGNVGMTGASGDAGAKLLSEQQKNIAAMGANSVAINEGRQALEKLANDGTKAANALAKIEEQQRQIEGLGNRFEKIFTSSPEELFKMNRQSDALALAQTAGAEQFKSRAFRQDAFAGLEQDKEFLSPEEYRKQRGMLMRKSLESRGYTGQSMIQKGGVNMTVDDFIKRIEGGMPSEEDPNVKAYREAVATQIKANEELARLEELKSLQIQEAMLGLQTFLANEFPKILTDAVKASREDAETKPSTKTEPTKAEKNKLEADKKYDTAKAKRDQIEGKITEEKRALAKAEKNVGWEQGAGVEVKQRKNKIKELEAQAAQQTSIMNEADAASAEAERSMTQEKKAKDQAKAAQAAEEKKAKEATVSTSIEQSQRARAGVAPTVIPAPPAPGSVEAKLEENRKKQADLIARQNKATETQTVPKPSSQAQTTAVTYGTTKPQVQTVDKFTEGRLNLEKTERTQELDRLTLSKSAKAKELKMKENTLRASKMAAEAAGTTETSPKLAAAQKAYDMAKADMASIDEQMKTDQDRVANINQQLAGIPQQTGGTPTSSSFSSMIEPPPGVSRREWLQQGVSQLASNPGMLSSTLPQPIPSNLPKPVEYTRQVKEADTGITQQPTKTAETSAQLITLDPSSLEGLNTFNTNFGAYVDKLVNFQFPTIPEKIEMTGTHTVDVRVTGAAAFESLQKNIQDMINKEIDVKMTQIWQQTGGQIGQRPGTPPSKGR